MEFNKTKRHAMAEKNAEEISNAISIASKFFKLTPHHFIGDKPLEKLNHSDTVVTTMCSHIQVCFVSDESGEIIDFSVLKNNKDFWGA